MGMTNSAAGYGSLTKIFHWAIAILFALQFFGGHIMTAIGFNASFAGIDTNTYYNWHKSLGLVALVVAVGRLINRQLGALPPWAPTLSSGERRFVHRAEQALYLAMFVMPVSGWFYVMWGHYGVNLFGLWEMPRPLTKDNTLRDVAKWIHVGASWLLLLALVGHIGLVMRHQFVKRDGLLKRML
ncbi:MAG: cytochrome b [Pseudomonadota bacterium]